jgi:hypothetical protein
MLIDTKSEYCCVVNEGTGIISELSLSIHLVSLINKVPCTRNKNSRRDYKDYYYIITVTSP